MYNVFLNMKKSFHSLPSGLYRRPWILTKSTDFVDFNKKLAGLFANSKNTAGRESHPP